jgi:hypothetical protein
MSNKQRAEAFSAIPQIPALTDTALDLWSLTTVRALAAPPLEPFLHGIPERPEPPQTTIAWRREVACTTNIDLPRSRMHQVARTLAIGAARLACIVVWPHCSQRIAVAAVVLEIAVMGDLGETSREVYAVEAGCRAAPCSVT